jgi:CheY-like chemotaxis protein
VRTDLAQLDLIVLDLRLPHASGIELVRSIRKMDDGRLPILVFSGTVGSVDEVRQLAALGVAGYVNEYSAVQHILPSLAPHLFPDNFNRRSSPRVVLRHPDRVSLRQYDRRGPDAQYQSRRHCHPDVQSAGLRGESAAAVPPAGFEEGYRGRGQGELEQPESGDGPGIRARGRS